MTLASESKFTSDDAREGLYLLYMSKAKAEPPVTPATAELKVQLLELTPPLVERVEMSADPATVLRYFDGK